MVTPSLYQKKLKMANYFIFDIQTPDHKYPQYRRL